MMQQRPEQCLGQAGVVGQGTSEVAPECRVGWHLQKPDPASCQLTPTGTGRDLSPQPWVPTEFSLHIILKICCLFCFGLAFFFPISSHLKFDSAHPLAIIF